MASCGDPLSRNVANDGTLPFFPFLRCERVSFVLQGDHDERKTTSIPISA